MKYLKVVFLTVILVSIMCITAYATDVGITDLTYHDTDTVINMFKADGTAVTADSNGVFLGAERFTLNYGAASPGNQYVIFVLSDNSGVPTESNILYIDQVFAAGSIISFDVYPKNITSGGTVYISGGATGMKKLASYEYFDLTNAFTVSLSNETVASGESVSVDVNLSNNPGIGALTLYVYYNDSLLTFNDFSAGELWTSHVISNITGSNTLDAYAANENDLSYQDADGINEKVVAIGYMTNKDMTGNGRLLSLNFDVAEVGENTETILELFCLKANNNDTNIDIFTRTVDGTVTIRIYTIGDVDNDGYFTATDALKALQISVGRPGFTDVQKLAANVDGDGYVTATDALKILHRAIGKIVSFSLEEIDK